VGLSIIRDNEDPRVTRLVDHLFRHQAGQVVATLTRILGPQHLQLAEDAVQEALIKALRHWSYRGVPENPAGWIMRAARNQAIDILRRESTLRAKQPDILLLQQMLPDCDDLNIVEDDLRDDQLRLMFTCCHPILPAESQVALTLKTLAGFGVPEIARAFLTSEAAIAQRLVRAKRTIRECSLPYEVPDGSDLEPRLEPVLSVLYLLFNEGYTAHQGADLVRQDLCAEAIRLTSILASRPVGDQPRVHALLALMLLQASRLPARADAAGDLLLLEQQDRSLWDRRLIALGLHELDRAAAGDRMSAFHLQAGIAAEHAVAPDYSGTNWPRILQYYTDLVALTGSPVSMLNRAVALAMVEGPEQGLAALRDLDGMPNMERYYLLHATTGELHRRAGHLQKARGCYELALRLTGNDSERRFLQYRLAMLESPHQSTL
jgi:RNA polymerase sigma factor (sigma-70 family)